jgi:hypothetical protein
MSALPSMMTPCNGSGEFMCTCGRRGEWVRPWVRLLPPTKHDRAASYVGEAAGFSIEASRGLVGLIALIVLVVFVDRFKQTTPLGDESRPREFVVVRQF